ncbi:MAG: alpha/beta hydrolase [Salinisphaera sp.]
MPGSRIGGQPVQLRITRLQAHPEGPTRHPVIYIPGGPGDAAGQDVSALQAWRRFQQAAAWPLDLVIVDPRGTGLSTPRPFCPTVRGSVGTSRLAECFHRLGRGTAERLGARAQVADLHRLIATLGQGGAVLWAESYGALIARRLAVQHPGDVRLLILDSPVLHPLPEKQRQAAASQRRRRQLLRACSRELSCRLAVPSLRATIDALRVWLQKHPATIAIAQPPLSARFVKIDGQMLRTLLLLSAYGHPDDMRVIRLLRRAAAQPAVLAALTGPLMALDRRSPRTAPVYWSTRCQFAQTRADSGVPAKRASCHQWPISRLPPVRHAVAVPTLVVAGTRDVLTPAAAAARATLAHPGWQFLPVGGAGHGTIRRDRCAQRVAARFIAHGGAWLGHAACPSRTNAGDQARHRANERRSNDGERLPR